MVSACEAADDDPDGDVIGEDRSGAARPDDDRTVDSSRSGDRRVAGPAGPDDAAATTEPLRRLLGFSALLVVLSLPFWALDLFADRLADWFPENLPASAIMVVVPATATAILVGRRDGRAGLARWLRRAVDAIRIRGLVRWAVVLLTMPTVYLLAWSVMRLLDVPLPGFATSWSTVSILLVAYFLAATAEELGWTAYATDALLPRWGTWATGVVLGLAWAGWHLPGFVNGGNGSWWVLWQCLSTVAFRTLIVWIYAWTDRSVFAATALHALSNVSWNLFPVNGSGYDPLYTTLIMTAGLAVLALLTRGRAVDGLATP